MTIQHLTAAEHIAEQSTYIDALTAENLQLRQRNATLAAINLRLCSTDLTADEVALSLMAGCPQWRQVGVQLLLHAVGTEIQQAPTKQAPPLMNMSLLTPKERALFDRLAINLGGIVSGDDLISYVWPGSAFNRDAHDKLWVLLRRLRLKLAEHAPTLRVETVRESGCMLLVVKGVAE